MRSAAAPKAKTTEAQRNARLGGLKLIQRPSCSSVSSMVNGLVPAAARRRNDAVHAQVFHHLAIVIKRVAHGKRSAE